MNKLSAGQERLDTIIFDLDGVVIDSARDIAAAVQHALKRLDCELKEYEYIRGCIGGGARNILLKCLPEDQKGLIDEALRYFGEYYTANCTRETVLYPGVADILAHYYGKKNIALATFKLRATTLKILTALEVLPYFAVIVAADDVERPKPDPQCILKIVEKLNCRQENTIIVGDTKMDVLTGKNAGIKTCAVLYGIGTASELAGCRPDYVIREIMQLKDIVG